MDKIDQFKADLKALLVEYNATISCSIDSDTHGLSYEMVVDFGSADKWKEYHLSNSCGLEYSDL